MMSFLSQHAFDLKLSNNMHGGDMSMSSLNFSECKYLKVKDLCIADGGV